MAELKTRQHDADVFEFINSFADTEQKRADSFELVKLMQEITGHPPKMWGPSIIGFGSYHYKSDRSRQEGDWLLVGFSPRKAAISLYVFTGRPEHEYLLSDLGKYTMGKACIYIKKLSDIDLEALKRLMRATIDFLEGSYASGKSPYASITVTTDVQAKVEHAWNCWTSTEFIKKWNHASDDWYCPKASNDLRVGGRFVYTMAALDGSVSFDFSGTYTEVVQGQRITSQLDDGRIVQVNFESTGLDRTRVIETFEAENANTLDLQRNGWQAILDNFKREVEADQKNG